MRLVCLLVALLIVAGCGGQAPEQPQDTRLPDLTLPAMGGGDTVALRSLEGPLVLNLWASWCVPCREELPHYVALAGEYDGRVDVIGVNWRDVRQDKAAAMLRKAGVRYANLRDADGEYPARFLPKLVMVDADGEVVFDEYREIKSLAELEGLVEKHLGVSR